MKDTMNKYWTYGVVTLSALAYVVVLVLFFELSHYQIMIFGAIPVFLAAWSFGFSGALIAVVGVTLINILFILANGGSPPTWISADGGGLGTLAILIIAFLIGHVRTLRVKLSREREVLLQTQDVTIFALAYEAELRDQATGRHLDRTSEYVKMLAEELARIPNYSKYLTKSYITDLVRAAPLHDIGKVGVPDSILLKPAKLTPAEFSIMREHCELGAQVLLKADEKLEFQSFLRIAIQIAMSHHEKWNGSGYPTKTDSGNIPISGRIMALADVYDALRTERVYKSAFSHSRTREIIAADSGTHFDPDLVNAFMRVHESFNLISNELADIGPSEELEMLEVVEL